jgi:hypothetical protein
MLKTQKLDILCACALTVNKIKGTYTVTSVMQELNLYA